MHRDATARSKVTRYTVKSIQSFFKPRMIILLYIEMLRSQLKRLSPEAEPRLRPIVSCSQRCDLSSSVVNQFFNTAGYQLLLPRHKGI